MSAGAPTVIYETVCGSRAQGLAREGSDRDIRGVIVGPPAWYHGFRRSRGEIRISPNHVRIEVRKLFKLLSKASPSWLEVLYTDPEHHLAMTGAGERLLGERDAFLSQKLRLSFGHYARTQIKALGRRWDPHDASHLVRLLRMGVEVVSTGEVRVLRPDREELLAIREGEWEKGRVMDHVCGLMDELRSRESVLPVVPDLDRLDALCISIVEQTLGC